MVEKPHKKLICWQLGVKFSVEIYKISQKFPEHEKFGLSSQIRRASVSIPTNIAEGAARNTTKEFINFLFIALGSVSEMDTLITIATQIGYLEKSEEDQLIKKIEDISKLISGLIKKLKETQS